MKLQRRKTCNFSRGEDMLRETIKNMKLKNRLTLFVLLAVAVVMAFGGLVQLKATADKIRADMSARMDLAADLTAESLSEPLWTYDEDSIKSIGNALFKDKYVGRVLINRHK